MKDGNSAYLRYKDFIQGNERQAVKPGLWHWKDVEDELQKVEEAGPLNPGRPSVCLVNNSTGDALGICPSLNAIVQVLAPGKHGKPHRHSNFAIFIVKEGKGYSVVNGQKLEWGVGDVFFAPAWARHEHCNTSQTERAVLYVVQDVPTVVRQGTWFFRGEDDMGPVVHNVVEG